MPFFFPKYFIEGFLRTFFFFNFDLPSDFMVSEAGNLPIITIDYLDTSLCAFP